MDSSRSESRNRITFGDFCFSAAERVLERAGKPVRLGGRAMDMLIALVEQPGQVVSQRRCLVIFDNCEHLLEDTGALIKAMLAQAAGLTVVLTSQEPMRLLPAHGFRLEALSLPPVGATEVSGFGAVGLFVERARSMPISR